MPTRKTTTETQDQPAEEMKTYVTDTDIVVRDGGQRRPTKVGVVLSTDMKNTVILEGETFDEVEELLPRAKELYAGLLAEYGVKPAPGRKPNVPQAARPQGQAPRAHSDGETIPCSNCGKPISGQVVRGEFQPASEIASWGEKKGFGPLCIGENGCYKQLVPRNGGGQQRQGGYQRGNNRYQGRSGGGGYPPRQPATDALDDLPF